MQVKAEKKEIILDSACGPEYISGNMELLITLLSNLIDNALKASPAGSVIRLDTAGEEDTLILEVTDQGIGMTKE